MSNVMAIGNTGAIDVTGSVNISMTREGNTSFTKVMGDNLRGMVKLPDKPNPPEISACTETGQNFAGNKLQKKLETDTSNANTPKEQDSIKEKLNDVKDSVKDEIKEKLGVSDEELEEKMAELGLTDADLLNPQAVWNLCLELGNADEMTLLSDGELYQTMTEIIDGLKGMLQNIQMEYQLPDEELIKQAEDLGNEIQVKEMPEEEVKVSTEQEIVQINTDEQETDTVQVQTETEFKKQDGGNEKQESHMFMNESHIAQQTNDTFVAATGEVPTSYVTTPTQSIMDQMIQSLKMEISPEVTELKMQLHPESLGNVSVQLSAKDGMITASFQAQNDAVKNVLESQMIQLKETLEEKGIQVEAVEVKVDTGAFNEQYEDAKGNDSKEAFEKEMKKNHPRQINLMDYTDGELAEMDASEELTVKMMKENGNSLDYSA